MLSFNVNHKGNMSFLFKYKPVSVLHLFYVLVFFVILPSLAQSQEITITDSIVWNQPIPSADPISGKSISRLFFNKAVFHDSVVLPFYQVKIPLRSGSTGYSSFKIVNVRACEMTLQELSLLGDRHLLSDSIIIRQSFATEKKNTIYPGFVCSDPKKPDKWQV